MVVICLAAPRNTYGGAIASRHCGQVCVAAFLNGPQREYARLKFWAILYTPTYDASE